MDWPAVVTIVGAICAVVLAVAKMFANGFETVFKAQVDRLLADSAAHDESARLRAERTQDLLEKLTKEIRRLKKKKCSGVASHAAQRRGKPAP